MTGLNQESDATLLQLMKRDNIEAYEVIYRKYGNQLFRAAFLRVGSREIAEEVTSDTLFLLWKKRHTIELDSESSLYPWLFVICANKSLNAIKSRFRYQDLMSNLATNTRFDDLLISSYFDRESNLEETYSILSTLSHTDREIILLRVIDDLSYDEIASILGISASTSRTRFSRATSRLREVATGYGLNFSKPYPQGEVR